MNTTKLNTCYQGAVTALVAELKDVEDRPNEYSIPSDAVLERVKEFLAELPAHADIPVIRFSYDGDVNLRWGKGRMSLLVSFCYDGLEHFSYRYETITRAQLFQVLNDSCGLDFCAPQPTLEQTA